MIYYEIFQIFTGIIVAQYNIVKVVISNNQFYY